MTGPLSKEPFPGAYSQRCVKCESAAESRLGRRIDDGQWEILAVCLNPGCGYSRPLDVDMKRLGNQGWSEYNPNDDGA